MAKTSPPKDTPVSPGIRCPLRNRGAAICTVRATGQALDRGAVSGHLIAREPGNWTDVPQIKSSLEQEQDFVNAVWCWMMLVRAEVYGNRQEPVPFSTGRYPGRTATSEQTWSKTTVRPMSGAGRTAAWPRAGRRPRIRGPGEYGRKLPLLGGSRQVRSISSGNPGDGSHTQPTPSTTETLTPVVTPRGRGIGTGPVPKLQRFPSRSRAL